MVNGKHRYPIKSFPRIEIKFKRYIVFLLKMFLIR